MASIQSFITNISPSSLEIGRISTSGGSIRNTIEQGLPFVRSSLLAGSYKRATKITPIDDLDIFFEIGGGRTWIEWESPEQTECILYIKDGDFASHPLKDFSTLVNYKHYISPNKIINEMRSRIADRYPQTSDIRKNGECVTTYFSSYDLTIDSVPYFSVKNQTYWLIPTAGNNYLWKKTNPKLDELRINELDASDRLNGKLKGAIKVMKYWNKHKNSGVKFKSYTLECWIYQILKYYTNYSASYTEILRYIIKEIYNDSYYEIVQDIPGYDYIYYPYTEAQWSRIKGLLGVMWEKLGDSEESFTYYLQN